MQCEINKLFWPDAKRHFKAVFVISYAARYLRHIDGQDQFLITGLFGALDKAHRLLGAGAGIKLKPRVISGQLPHILKGYRGGRRKAKRDVSGGTLASHNQVSSGVGQPTHAHWSNPKRRVKPLSQKMGFEAPFGDIAQDTRLQIDRIKTGTIARQRSFPACGTVDKIINHPGQTALCRLSGIVITDNFRPKG